MNRPNAFARATTSVAGFFRRRIEVARSGGRSAGASAVEWVIISAIVAALVAGIGFAISQAVNNKKDKVVTCIDKSDTSSC
ncbi:MAG: hypothetical protein HOY69_09850 [Streptomyces sp.]|nr:hypothetical protein [Streptomyces sp.]